MYVADVPVSQAVALADALKHAGKDYEIVVIPGGDHGFVTKGACAGDGGGDAFSDRPIAAITLTFRHISPARGPLQIPCSLLTCQPL